MRVLLFSYLLITTKAKLELCCFYICLVELRKELGFCCFSLYLVAIRWCWLFHLYSIECCDKCYIWVLQRSFELRWHFMSHQDVVVIWAHFSNFTFETMHFNFMVRYSTLFALHLAPITKELWFGALLKPHSDRISRYYTTISLNSWSHRSITTRI